MTMNLTKMNLAIGHAHNFAARNSITMPNSPIKAHTRPMPNSSMIKAHTRPTPNSSMIKAHTRPMPNGK